MVTDELKVKYPVNAPVFRFHQDGRNISARVLKHGRKYIWVEQDESPRVTKVLPDNIEHQHLFLKRQGVGMSVSPGDLPKTGDPEYLPDVIKEADYMCIDLRGRVMKHVGIGWVCEEDYADRDVYEHLPYLIPKE